jgi:hypothetical protein
LEICSISWGKMLLDESAWQAVGRSVGWHHKSWRKYMRLMGEAVVSRPIRASIGHGFDLMVQGRPTV